MTVVDRGESAAEDADRGAQAPVSTPGRGSVVATVTTSAAVTAATITATTADEISSTEVSIGDRHIGDVAGLAAAPRLLNALPVLARFLVLGVQRFTLGGTK
jgi:hypothetical protein